MISKLRVADEKVSGFMSQQSVTMKLLIAVAVISMISFPIIINHMNKIEKHVSSPIENVKE
jgi:hypothetical protein